MKEKDAGFAEKLLPVLLSTGMVLGLVLLSGRLMDVLRTREQMNQIARAYMLVMESEGCINSANLRGLREDLESEGLTDISFSGTTTTPVDYGDSIQLVITGNMKMNLKVAVPYLYETDKDWTVPIKIQMYSTAKH